MEGTTWMVGRWSRRAVISCALIVGMLGGAFVTSSATAQHSTGTHTSPWVAGETNGNEIAQGFDLSGACEVGNSCVVTATALDCEDMGGTFFGASTICCPDGTTGCTQCCFADGTCDFLKTDDCIALGGSPAWDSSANAGAGGFDLYQPCDNGCDPVSACCLPDGTCVSAQERFCSQYWGGMYLGHQLKNPDPCIDSECFGACCLPPVDGVEQACLDGVSRENCEALGGSFLGDGSICPDPGAPCYLVVECDTYSVPIPAKGSRIPPDEANAEPFAVPQFPDDPLRELRRVTVDLDGYAYHYYFGINFFEDVQTLSLSLLEEHNLLSIAGEDPFPLPGLNLLEIEDGEEFRPGVPLAQGETFFYGSPDLFRYEPPYGSPYHAEYEAPLDDLTEFIGAGDVGAELFVQGSILTQPLSKFGVISLSHVAEVELCITYEFEQLGACCFCDGTCIDGLSMEACALEPHPSNPMYDNTGIWYAGLFCADLTLPQCDDTLGYCCLLGTLQCTPDVTARCCEEVLSGLWYPTEEECIENCEECIPGEPNDCGGKGSLVIISKVDVRWDAFGNLLQDTFIQLSNDYPGDVFVQMYFVNGDDPLPMMGEERPHPGWNNVDNMIMLTGNQTRAWSAVEGDFGISPWTVLDPGDPPGRPADDGSGERVLRGFIYAWAVTVENVELSWNHLSGGATLVRYDIPSAWEYEACTFSSLEPFNTVHGSPGVLNLDGYEYGAPPDLLLMNFQEVGSESWSSPSIETESWTSITLHPASADLRLDDTTGPISTTAEFFVWNENEQKLGGDFHCFTCWDQRYLDQLTVAQNFGNLGTDQGFALIDGRASVLCNEPGMVTQAAALLGLRAHHLSFSPPAGGGDADGTTGPPNGRSTSGGPLMGCGVECAKIWYDVLEEPPPESKGAFAPADRFVKEWIETRRTVR